MTQIIAVSNQKGGVGKTTTSISMAAGFASTGVRTLLLDLDPQANATSGSGVRSEQFQKSIYHALSGQADLDELIVKTQEGYVLIPSQVDLAAVTVELKAEHFDQIRLCNLIRPIQDNFDRIIIDCPPSLNILTVNAFAAANVVLIPVQCEYFALEGMNDLLNTIKRIKKELNPDLEILGILRTMYDGRNLLANEVSEQLNRHLGQHLLNTIIPRNIRLAEAPGFGCSVLKYDQRCLGAVAYQTLIGELMMRTEKGSD